MCGITGIWNLNRKPVVENEIECFNNTLFHRGPDGFGIYTESETGLALGHRRLSIIDLSEAGKQPMSFNDQNLIITFNGEIYNFIELRNQLVKKGYIFNTRTDTEVILAAYKEWGQNCVDKFNGMWAFAIWDKSKKELFLSRDRFGVKPLYYTYTPGELFAFSSESISFSKLAGFQKKMDNVNLSINLRNPFYLEAIGETIYGSIKKLKPGHNITLSMNYSLKERMWWSTAEHLIDLPQSYDEQVDQFKDLLMDSCKLRLRSDVPVGIALSGGLDSSSIYSTIKLIADQNNIDLKYLPNEWQTAFIASFPGTEMDEKKYADEVVKYTNGKAVYICPDEKNIADSIYYQTKAEDFIYLSPPVVHSIYREMRNNGIKVSLDGHGADEMLFGYADMIFEWAWNEKNETNSKDLQTAWAGFNSNLNNTVEKIFQNRNTLQEKSICRVLYEKLIPDTLKEFYREKQYNRRRQNSFITKYSILKKNWDFVDSKGKSLDYSIPYRKFHIDSLPTLLRNWDRASMQHGVEIRMPFMDWRLVTYVFSLPGGSKVRNGYSKSILRDAVKNQLPESIRLRKNKIGINAPMVEWFNGPMSGFISDAVSSQSFLKSDVWNGPLLRSRIEKLCKEKSWNQAVCNDLWPFINAWILQN